MTAYQRHDSDFILRTNARIAKNKRGSATTTVALSEDAMRMPRLVLQEQHPFNDPNRRTLLAMQLALDLRTAHDIDSINRCVLQNIAACLGVQYASIMVSNSDGSIDTAHSLRDGMVRPISAAQRHQAVTHGATGHVLRNGRSIISSASATDQTGGSLLVVPIRQGDTTLGTMALFHPLKGIFTPQDLWLMESIAGHISIAIMTVRRHQEEYRLRNQVMSLSTMHQFVATDHTVEELAQFVQEKSGEVFGAEYGAIFLRNQKSQPQPVALPNTAMSEALLRCANECAQHGWSIRHTVTEVPMPGSATQKATCLAIPMTYQGDVIGTFVLLFTANSTAFPVTIWSLLMLFGSMIAAACSTMQSNDIAAHQPLHA